MSVYIDLDESNGYELHEWQVISTNEQVSRIGSMSV